MGGWGGGGIGWVFGVCRQARLRVRRCGEASAEGGKSVLPAVLLSTEHSHFWTGT